MTNSSISQLNEISAENKLDIVDGWFVQLLPKDVISHSFNNNSTNSLLNTFDNDNQVNVEHCLSPHCAPREPNDAISLLVVHNISLPPGKFGSQHISDFFQGCLNKDDDPYFETIHEMQVSAH